MNKLYIKYLLSVLSAALVICSFPPIYISHLIWFSLVPLFIAFYNSDSKTSFRLGFLCGFLINIGAFNWIIVTIVNFSNLNIFLALLALVLFAMWGGIFFGLLGFLFYHISKQKYAAVTIPALYLSLEFVFPLIFPWEIGASLYKDITFIQIADIFGVYGVSFVVVLVNAFIFRTYAQKKFLIKEFIAVFLVLVFVVSYGIYRKNCNFINKDKSYDVMMVQPNISNNEKTMGMESIMYADYIMETLRSLSVSQRADLVIWPETALPFIFPYNEFESNELKKFVQEAGFDLLVGTIAMENEETVFNSAFIISKDGSIVGRYDKVNLLIFGEYMPFSNYFPKLQEWITGGGNFTRGRGFHPVEYNGMKISIPICYEIIKPAIIRKFITPGENVLVNITNDGWFGDTAEPEQHLMLSIFRAIESRAPIVRVTNSGISALIDVYGEIKERIPFNKKDQKVIKVSPGTTNTIYQTIGDLLAYICISVTIVILIVTVVRKKKCA